MQSSAKFLGRSVLYGIKGPGSEADLADTCYEGQILGKKLGTVLVSWTPWIKALFSGVDRNFPSNYIHEDHIFHDERNRRDVFFRCRTGPIATHFGVALQRCYGFTTGRTLKAYRYTILYSRWKIYGNSKYNYISNNHIDIATVIPFVECVWDSHSYLLRLLRSLRRQMITSLPVPLLGTMKRAGLVTEEFGLMIWLQMNHVAFLKMNRYENTGLKTLSSHITASYTNYTIYHTYCSNSNLWMQLAIDTSHLIILWTTIYPHNVWSAWSGMFLRTEVASCLCVGELFSRWSVKGFYDLAHLWAWRTDQDWDDPQVWIWMEYDLECPHETIKQLTVMSTQIFFWRNQCTSTRKELGDLGGWCQ